MIEVEEQMADRRWEELFRARWWQEDRLVLARLGIWVLLITFLGTGYASVMQGVLGHFADGTLLRSAARVYCSIAMSLAMLGALLSVIILAGVRAAGDAQGALEEAYQRERLDHGDACTSTLSVTTATTAGGRACAERLPSLGILISLLALGLAVHIFVTVGF